ncbi:hypothetical protein M2284_001320 [Rhodococcus sp. LBL1]|nr:hypothetical protein [Rhodococcus sp. LBL1]MDH6682585.1 hypothetical protein [Rhodococcus sp. LBL2]
MTVVFAMPAARGGSFGGDPTYLTIAKLLPRLVGKVNAHLSAPVRHRMTRMNVVRAETLRRGWKGHLLATAESA